MQTNILIYVYIYHTNINVLITTLRASPFDTGIIVIHVVISGGGSLGQGWPWPPSPPPQFLIFYIIYINYF